MDDECEERAAQGSSQLRAKVQLRSLGRALGYTHRRLNQEALEAEVPLTCIHLHFLSGTRTVRYVCAMCAAAKYICG